MNTDHLIEHLAAEVSAVPRHARQQRIAIGVAAGCAVTFTLVVAVLGLRPDLATATRGFSFWMKSAYTISLGVGALVITARLAQPEPVRLRRFWSALIPCAVLAIVGVVEMARAPAQDWLAMWLGATWRVCPWLVLGLSFPLLLGLSWSFARLAPTRLRAAGAAAGFAAGSWAAVLYGLHCPEVSAIFVLTWYSLGVALAAAIGALLGPSVLRW